MPISLSRPRKKAALEQSWWILRTPSSPPTLPIIRLSAWMHCAAHAGDMEVAMDDDALTVFMCSMSSMDEATYPPTEPARTTPCLSTPPSATQNS